MHATFPHSGNLYHICIHVNIYIKKHPCCISGQWGLHIRSTVSHLCNELYTSGQLLHNWKMMFTIRWVYACYVYWGLHICASGVSRDNCVNGVCDIKYHLQQGLPTLRQVWCSLVFVLQFQLRTFPNVMMKFTTSLSPSLFGADPPYSAVVSLPENDDLAKTNENEIHTSLSRLVSI